VLLGAVRKSLGKDAAVELASQERKKCTAIIGYASNDDVKVTLLLMPLQRNEKSSRLGKPTAFGKAEERNRELRDELKAMTANMEMWKSKAMEAEKGGAKELEAKLAEAEERAKHNEEKACKWAAKAREAEKALEQKGEPVDDSRVKELEAELAKVKAELDEVWRENATLKATKTKETEKVEDTAAEVTLDTMRKWCEGKNLVATQKRPGCCIWVEGESKPYESELKELGFRWAGKSRKAWYLKN
jgi:flagellar biosynthesis GTPase FlhF